MSELADEETIELRAAHEELRQMNLVLEHLVDMRTKALVDANQELEAFAYSVRLQGATVFFRLPKEGGAT